METGSEWSDYNTGVLNIVITKMSGLCYDNGPVPCTAGKKD